MYRTQAQSRTSSPAWFPLAEFGAELLRWLRSLLDRGATLLLVLDGRFEVAISLIPRRMLLDSSTRRAKTQRAFNAESSGDSSSVAK